MTCKAQQPIPRPSTPVPTQIAAFPPHRGNPAGSIISLFSLSVVFKYVPVSSCLCPNIEGRVSGPTLARIFVCYVCHCRQSIIQNIRKYNSMIFFRLYPFDLAFVLQFNKR